MLVRNKIFFVGRNKTTNGRNYYYMAVSLFMHLIQKICTQRVIVTTYYICI